MDKTFKVLKMQKVKELNQKAYTDYYVVIFVYMTQHTLWKSWTSLIAPTI